MTDHHLCGSAADRGTGPMNLRSGPPSVSMRSELQILVAPIWHLLGT